MSAVAQLTTQTAVSSAASRRSGHAERQQTEFGPSSAADQSGKGQDGGFLHCCKGILLNNLSVRWSCPELYLCVSLELFCLCQQQRSLELLVPDGSLSRLELPLIILNFTLRDTQLQHTKATAMATCQAYGFCMMYHVCCVNKLLGAWYVMLGDVRLQDTTGAWTATVGEVCAQAFAALP